MIATEELGDRTYIAHDGEVAVVIDPQLDIDRLESALQAHKRTCGLVLETHLVDVNRVDELTRAQYHSVRPLAERLPDDTEIFPAHGFGSFGSSGDATGGDNSTLGIERGRNDALTLDDADEFVGKLIARLTAYPAYYAHMGAIDGSGAGPIDLSAPAMADGEELRKRIAAGEWVVDLRNRTAFAKSHIHGTVSIALEKPFATYLGWVIPWGTPLTLIAQSADEITGAQRQLVRIGIDRPVAAAVGEPGDLVGADDTDTYAVATFEDLHRAIQPLVIDVRRDDERQVSHLKSSIHLPLHSLETTLGELPHEPLWVHCASGFRASIAASLLARAGFEVVLIDDDWPNAKQAGLNIETGSAS